MVRGTLFLNINNNTRDMKKFMCAIALMFMTLGVGVAQQVEMRAQEVKSLTSGQASGAYFVGKKDGLSVMVTNVKYYMNADISTGVAIYGLNDEGKAEKKLMVSKSKESMLVDANMQGDTIYMVVCGAVKGEPCDMHVFKANLTSWTLVGEPKVLYHRRNKESNMMDWEVRTSPDGHVKAISIKEYSNSTRIAKAFGKEDAEYDAIVVADSRYAEMWRRDDLPGWYSQLTVDDNEMVHAMLVGVSDSRTYLLFANHSSMGDEMNVDSLERGDLASYQLLNYVDGCFVVGGTIGEKRRGLHNIQYSALYGLSYDSQSKKMVFNPQALSETEFAVLENVDLGARRSKESEIQGLTTKTGVATPYGGVMQILAFMTTTVYSKGTVDYVFDLHGSLMVAIDKNANFVWRVPIRTHIRSGNDMSPIRQHVAYHGGKTYVIQTESVKAPTGYDISQKVPMLAIMGASKSTLSVYAIDDGGRVEKYTLPQDKLLFLTGRLHRVDDDWFVTLSKLGKSRIVHIKGI